MTVLKTYQYLLFIQFSNKPTLFSVFTLKQTLFFSITRLALQYD